MYKTDWHAPMHWQGFASGVHLILFRVRQIGRVCYVGLAELPLALADMDRLATGGACQPSALQRAQEWIMHGPYGRQCRRDIGGFLRIICTDKIGRLCYVGLAELPLALADMDRLATGGACQHSALQRPREWIMHGPYGRQCRRHVGGFLRIPPTSLRIRLGASATSAWPNCRWPSLTWTALPPAVITHGPYGRQHRRRVG